jgi:hypothetical protein
MKPQIPHDHAAVLDAIESLKLLQQCCGEYGDEAMGKAAMLARLEILKAIAERPCR